MQLKSLTLYGFKSFADKTKIEFRPGITGVVGPNGSGKSNIIEALRWVLGEQSAKGLRGGKMSDVIFVGAQNRAPLNRAEVVLELDNSDGFLKNQPADLMITRRIYRDGESEFLLNQKNVRLRDILEMFMDTGLGKESFSIISQGKVEAIFNSKPQERRALIEETAGVLKYKNEKQKATQELAETSDHLDRVSDIITELYQQKEPLEQQASIARDYLEQKKQLDYYDLSYLVLEIEEKNQQKEQLQVQLKQLAAILQKQVSQAKKQAKQSQEIEQQQQDNQQKLDDLQAKLIETTKQQERLAGQHDMSLQEQEFQATRTKELTNQITTNEELLADLRQQEASLQAEVLTAKQTQDDLAVKIEEIKQTKQVQPEELEQQIAQINQGIVEILQQQAKLQSQTQYLQQEQQRASQQQDQTAQQTASLQQELLQSENLLAKQNEELALIDEKIATKTLQQDELKTKQDELKRLKAQQTKSWYQASEILQRARTKHETLENIAESYDGYYQGVKGVLQAKQQLPGIVDAVAKLLDVPGDYAKAIETALGTQLQNIVTKDENAAKQAIAYLNKQRLGRATFLPQNTVKPRFLSVQQQEIVAKHPGGLGVGAQLVKVSKENQRVLEYLLGATVLAKDLDAAVQIARQLNYSVKIVTLDGDVVNAGGALSGGANKQQKLGLLEQKQQVTKLAQDIEVMQQKLTALEQMGTKTNTRLQQIEQQLKEVEKTLAELMHTRNQIQKQVDVYHLQVKHQQERFNELQETIQTAKQATKNFVTQENDLISQKAKLSHKLQKLQVKQATKQDYLKNVQALKQDYLDVVSQTKQQQAVVAERLQAKQLQLNEVKNQSLRVLEVIQKAQVNLRQLQNNTKQDEQTVEDLQRKQALMVKQAQELTVKITKLQEQRLQLSQAAKEAKEQLDRVTQLQHTIYDQQRSLSVKEAKQTTLLDGYLNDLAQKYGLTFEAAKQQERETNRQIIERKLKLLKLGIEELGEVNLGAISEYERISQRYDFLSQQQADLLAAKEQLLQSMNEMDEEVKLRFKQTFAQVAAAFAQIFPKMFGGGQAYLSLTEPNDLLNTGIEITAQPPGKKAQQLSLLSGGERSLTAITLLFAILKVRPVPFVVLDEAEAALDDANVARYARYLRHFDDQTQFIVITHRKGTMMNADVLYGVTMQESGVSQMVSVALDDVI